MSAIIKAADEACRWLEARSLGGEADAIAKELREALEAKAPAGADITTERLVDRIRERRTASVQDGQGWNYGLWDTLYEAEKFITQQAARIEELEKNAARYQEWKRAFREGECSLWNALCEAQNDAEHDAAIDAAIRQQAEGGAV